jgi:isopentenyl-diphosphate delta-isomerase
MLRTGPTSKTAGRKADHLRINVEADVAAKGVRTGFESWRFVHCALPEIDFEDVRTNCEFLGKPLGAPLLVSCMTGGTEEAGKINRRLAGVAQRLQFAMGVGSGRALLEDPKAIETFDVRETAPDIPLFANIGAVQLNKGYDVEDCRRLVRALGADALVLHLNPLQEALQPEGDTSFGGLLEKIARLCDALGTPVIVKEVGWGISPDIVKALLDRGVRAIDVAGAGGTSWSEVEKHRIEEPWRKRVAERFADWGIPTADCIADARAVAPDAPLIASGGIRDGIDVAKAIALGADIAGIAGPFLRAAVVGEEAADELAREIVLTLRIAMFATGTPTLKELKRGARLYPCHPERSRRTDEGSARA